MPRLRMRPIGLHTADATKLSSCVASASAVCTWIRKLTTTADGYGNVNAAVGRDPVYNAANARSRIWRNMALHACKHSNQLCSAILECNIFYNFFNNDVIMSSLVSTGNCKLGHDCRRVCSHRRHDATRQFRRVGVGGVFWAWASSYALYDTACTGMPVKLCPRVYSYCTWTLRISNVLFRVVRPS